MYIQLLPVTAVAWARHEWDSRAELEEHPWHDEDRNGARAPVPDSLQIDFPFVGRPVTGDLSRNGEMI